MSESPTPTGNESKRIMCAVLAVVLPAFAIHRFMLGDTKGGIIRIVANIACGAGAIISFVEGIIYFTKSDADFIQTYQVGKKAWF